MKKVELIEFINERLPIDLHPAVVEKYMNAIYNQIIFNTYRSGDPSFDMFLQEKKDITVSYDKNTETWYSLLPVQICQLPEEGNGVVRIATYKGKSLEFVPVNSLLQVIHEDLEVSFVSGHVPYYVSGKRIEYAHRNGIESVEKVRVWVIQQFESYGMYDDVPIPKGMEKDLIDMVVQFALGKTPDDLVNDDNEKTT